MSSDDDSSSCSATEAVWGEETNARAAASEAVEAGVTYTLRSPGAFAVLLAGCGVQQATRVRGNTCDVLWDRLASGDGTREKESVSQLVKSESDARAVPHRCVPTRVLETAVAPFLGVAVAVIGLCPVPEDTAEDRSTHYRRSSQAAQVFMRAPPEGVLLLPRVVFLPPAALCALEATKHSEDPEMVRPVDPLGIDAGDPWRRFASTACLEPTSAQTSTVLKVATIADVLTQIAEVAPFVSTLQMGACAHSVSGELHLTDATVTGLGFVKAVKGVNFNLSFLRSLLFQLNNDRRFSGVTAEGKIATMPRLSSGTQVESLQSLCFNGPVDKAWVNDDYSNLTSLDSLANGRDLFYFVRSCRKSLRHFETGFSGNLPVLLEAAREEQIISAAVGDDGRMVESIGTLLPAMTSMCITENSVEKGAFASLCDRKMAYLCVDDCGADADDFLHFCRHPLKPAEHCADLNLRTTSFDPAVVTAALPHFTALQSYACGYGTNYEALRAIADHCPLINDLNIVGFRDDGTTSESAELLAKIVGRRAIRSVNLVEAPLTAAAVRAVRAASAEDGQMESLRMLRAGPLCEEHLESTSAFKSQVADLFLQITYDYSKRRLQLPDELTEILATVEPPLTLLPSEKSLGGDVAFVSSHRLDTQQLPPVQQATNGGTTLTLDSDVAPATASRLTSIGVSLWEMDVPALLPMVVRIGMGHAALLRRVSLGGPSSVLLAVADHCPLLEDLSWAVASGSDDPLAAWCFGPAPRRAPVPEFKDLSSAVLFVEATDTFHRPTCSRTLESLIIAYKTPAHALSDERSEITAAAWFAVSCAMFASMCPALTGVEIQDESRGSRYELTRMVADLVTATTAQGRRPCSFKF